MNKNSTCQSASSSALAKRTALEVLRHGVDCFRSIVQAACNLLETRPAYRLSCEIQRYKRHLKTQNRSLSTLEELSILRALARIVGRNAAVVDVLPCHIVRLLEGRRISRKTANIYRNDLAGFFQWWSKLHQVRFNPAVLVDMTKLELRLGSARSSLTGGSLEKGKRQLRRDANMLRRLSNRQIIRLLFLAVRYRPDAIPILVVSLFLGLRPEMEAVPLWQDLDWDHMTWKIQASSSKIGKYRPVPVPPVVIAWLRPWQGATGPICLFGYGSWKAIRKRLFKLARITYRHDCLRVTGASNWFAFFGRRLDFLAESFGNSPEVLKSVYLDPPSATEAAIFMQLLPPNRWAPRLDGKVHGRNWRKIPAGSVMENPLTLRQWINFLAAAREPRTPTPKTEQ